MRFYKKIDCVFWFIVAVLPILVFVVSFFRSPETANFVTFISAYRFDFVANIFNQIFTDNLVFPSVLVDFLSYFVSVDIIHVFIDFIVFIPRFAHKLTNKFYGD